MHVHGWVGIDLPHCVSDLRCRKGKEGNEENFSFCPFVCFEGMFVFFCHCHCQVKSGDG